MFTKLIVNTPSFNSEPATLTDSAKALDKVIWLDHNKTLSERSNVKLASKIDSFIDIAKLESIDHDIILLMTNKDSQKILRPLINYLEKK